MSDTFFAIKTNRAGDILVSCNFDSLRWPALHWAGRLTRRLVRSFVWLENLAQYRVVVTAGVGLGLGVSLTWLVYSQPFQVTAQPSVAVVQGQRYQQVRRGEGDAWRRIDDGLGGFLLELQLGEQVELLAENNGIYRYRVVEIRQVPTVELAKVRGFFVDQVVLVAPTSVFRTHQVVIVLR